MGIIKRAQGVIRGLTGVLDSIRSDLGDLTGLNTTAKNSAVAAINELKTEVDRIDGYTADIEHLQAGESIVIDTELGGSKLAWAMIETVANHTAITIPADPVELVDGQYQSIPNAESGIADGAIQSLAFADALPATTKILTRVQGCYYTYQNGHWVNLGLNEFVPGNIVWPMASDTDHGQTITASSTATGYDARQVFGGNRSTSDIYDNWQANNPTGWLAIDMGHNQTITGYSVTRPAGNSHIAESWQLQGSNNGTDWTTLDTVTNATYPDQTEQRTLPAPENYQYYRLNITASTGNASISRLKLFGNPYNLATDGNTPEELEALAVTEWAQLYADGPSTIAFMYLCDQMLINPTATVYLGVEPGGWQPCTEQQMAINWVDDQVTFIAEQTGNYMLVCQRVGHQYRAADTVIGTKLVATGGEGGEWISVDARGNAITTPDTPWFNSHPVWGNIQDQMIDGQHMVKIPKFYCCRTLLNDGKEAWFISPEPSRGFTVHPAFVLNGVEVDQFWIGKYQASLSAPIPSGQLQSIPGVMPVTDISIEEANTAINVLNSTGQGGFRQIHMDMINALQWLFLIEHASPDAQGKIAKGHVNGGSILNVDDPAVAAATYRGIVGLWGNISQLVEGIRTSYGSIHYASYTGDWQTVRETLPGEGGSAYITTLKFPTTNTHLFIPDCTTGKNERSTIKDRIRYYQGSTETYYAAYGGDYSEDYLPGLWYLYVRQAWSAKESWLGARLGRVV